MIYHDIKYVVQYLDSRLDLFRSLKYNMFLIYLYISKQINIIYIYIQYIHSQTGIYHEELATHPPLHKKQPDGTRCCVVRRKIAPATIWQRVMFTPLATSQIEKGVLQFNKKAATSQH